ncbi:platelet-activating factor acetylhydrolase, isoform II-domain-containing protein [Entophlyctis helioformis]|nr:platelet-activating factor acetylhydrolase, isoform II-domain-containing protein [Entophlyctis helioformis]
MTTMQHSASTSDVTATPSTASGTAPASVVGQQHQLKHANHSTASVRSARSSLELPRLQRPASWLPLPKLANYNGPFKVGVVDVEPRSSAVEKGLLLRMYFPTVDQPHTPHARWLPKRLMYSLGYADFMSIPAPLALFFVTPAMAPVDTPGYLNAPLRPESPATAATPALPGKLPVIFFSHGLAGMRTTYSTICGCLAAKGFIVVAVEHGDGSGAATARNEFTTRIPFRRPTKEEIQPGETQDEYLKRFRSGQVQYRADEIMAAVELIKAINAGTFDSKKDNILHNQTFDLTSFSGRLDLDNMAIAGHSFGGATTLEVLSRENHPFKCGVTTDPWMFPLLHLNRVTVPHLTIQSETFHWRDNINELSQMLKSANANPNNRVGMIKNTAHNDFSDFSGLFPSTLRRVGQTGKGDPLVCQLINDEWMTEFFRTFLTTSQLAIPEFPAYNIHDPVDTLDVVLKDEEALDHIFANLKK